MAKRVRSGDYVEFLVHTYGYGAWSQIEIYPGAIFQVVRGTVNKKQLFVIIENRVFLIRANKKEYKVIPKSKMADLLYSNE